MNTGSINDSDNDSNDVNVNVNDHNERFVDSRSNSTHTGTKHFQGWDSWYHVNKSDPNSNTTNNNNSNSNSNSNSNRINLANDVKLCTLLQSITHHIQKRTSQ